MPKQPPTKHDPFNANPVHLDAAKMLQKAARELQRLHKHNPNGATYRPALTSIHANINAALARIPDAPTL